MNYRFNKKMELSDDLLWAKKTLTRMLTRRDHSELEIRQKLSLRFLDKTIEETLEWANKLGWLQNPEILAFKLTESLNRKNKGVRYIQNQLRKKGLPVISIDEEKELHKAQRLVSKKFGTPIDSKLYRKIILFLQQRGFDSTVIQKVIYENR